jgi:hypothetical protein
MRKKLNEDEKKIRVTITLDRAVVELLKIKNNKSKYIEGLIYKDLKIDKYE